MTDQPTRDTFEFAVGLRATHAHVLRTLGKRRFKSMMKELRPHISLRSFAMKVPMSVAAFQLAQQDGLEQEQRAAFIAAAVELKLKEDGNN
jgi:hypothetical protein